MSDSSRASSRGWLLLKLLIGLAALSFVIRGLDTDSFLTALARIPLWQIGLMMVATLLNVGWLGLRLRFVLRTKTYAPPLEGASLALGFNNLLPAKLGELVKLEFLARRLRLPRTQVLNAVFWERFSDANLLLLMAALAAVLAGPPLLFVPLAMILLLFWLVLVLLARYGTTSDLWIGRLLRFPRLVDPARDLRQHLAGGLQGRYLGGLAAYSLVLWLLYALHLGLVLTWLGSLSLSTEAWLVTFVFSVAGFAIPALPAAVGTYEASIVLGLGLYGVPREQALAIALVAHAVQFVPTTGAALLIFVLRRAPASASPTPAAD